MVTKIKKWGNSQGLRLPKHVLEDTCLEVGDEVDVLSRDGIIVIAPVRRARGKHSLKSLIASIPKGHAGEEIAWGDPVGREAW